MHSITGISKLLWSLQDIQTDRLVGFTGPERVLQTLAFGLMSFGKPVSVNVDYERMNKTSFAIEGRWKNIGLV